MQTKQLLFTGAVVAGTAKFYGGLSWQGALILGAVAALSAAVADNVLPQ